MNAAKPTIGTCAPITLPVLALVAALGCGRSSLDVPEPPAAALGDDAGTEIPLSGDDAGSSGEGDEGGTSSGAPGQTTPHDASTVSPPPPSTNDAALFFRPPPATDASGASGDGSGGGDGSGCGPATCTGCCLNGTCEPGGDSDACGIHGNACVRCGPEWSCDRGTCE